MRSVAQKHVARKPWGSGDAWLFFVVRILQRADYAWVNV